MNTDIAQLRADYLALGSELDAAYDGALHHAFDARKADALLDVLEYRYDQARAAYFAAVDTRVA